ncbi:HXXXD-type acyl-transferase family protein [Striga hermonthica]|uniref:HXXXD-type acyl-transferase family protein n=1 Tax=Striga hermonthica TaxID=68872 RepID=A0A9N7NH60_STRHE|nr:HXXXD-type acyl-transferase family protein [Striga hermonthica]
MAAVLPNPAMQDLKITYQESTLVLPCQQTHTKTTFLSNIDHFLNFNVPMTHFFRANPDFPPETVAARLKMAVEKVLLHYDFMAGRLKWNHHCGRAEIEGNSAGVGFVVASSELSVNDIGDLACPNMGFRQLASQKLDGLSEHDQPLCTFQVTSFKCGGFAIGISMNHILLDGVAAKMFQENIASQAFEDHRLLQYVPFHDRRLLAARSPPLVTFPHPEIFKPMGLALGPLPQGSNQPLSRTVLKMNSKDIDFLKTKAKFSSTDENVKITSFKVVAALVWRCRALSACDVDKNRDRDSTIFTVVDLRSRLKEIHLPAEYCGNAIYGGYASAKCKEIEEWPFSKLVGMVSEGVEKVNDEYVRSAIDWMEMNKGGLPLGDCIVSSWLRLGFNRVAFPWGRPVQCVPVANQLERLCWVFPESGGDGVNVLVQRPNEEMERFIVHFQDFFADTKW